MGETQVQYLPLPDGEQGFEPTSQVSTLITGLSDILGWGSFMLFYFQKVVIGKGTWISHIPG